MATAASATPEQPQPIGGTGVLAAGAMGAVVALALGLYGRAHDPQCEHSGRKLRACLPDSCPVRGRLRGA